MLQDYRQLNVVVSGDGRCREMCKILYLYTNGDKYECDLVQ